MSIQIWFSQKGIHPKEELVFSSNHIIGREQDKKGISITKDTIPIKITEEDTKDRETRLEIKQEIGNTTSFTYKICTMRIIIK
jgi:hypothetical protein